MLEFLAANLSTILVSAVLLLVGLSVRSMARSFRSGGCAGCSSCKGGCAKCGGHPSARQ